MANKKIQIFNRHCAFSSVSQFKDRPVWFDRERIHKNLLSTLNPELCDLHIFFDGDGWGNHFVKKYHEEVESKSFGSEASSFIGLIEHVASLSLDKGTIIYIVEDDYLHAPNWCEAMLDGFNLFGNSKSYITLYDHADKYFFPEYADLRSKIVAGNVCHWRNTPSTTNTYAGTIERFIADIDYHLLFSRGVSITRDHQKFLALGEAGKTLYSSIPGYSTHCEPAYLSPAVNWLNILEATT